jgi:hypothetical protein
MITRVGGEPRVDRRMGVRSVVVENQMDVAAGGHGPMENK